MLQYVSSVTEKSGGPRVATGSWLTFRSGLIIIITTEATDELSYLRRLSLQIPIYFTAPSDLFIPRSQQITAYPYMRHSSRWQSSAALVSHQPRFFILRVKWACRRHTTCHQHNQHATNKNKLKTVSHH